MRIEALRPLHIRRASGDLHLKPGYPVELPDDDALRLLAKKPDAVRQVLTVEPLIDPLEAVPTPPLQPGWLVVYRDPQGRLRGGHDERDHGTVAKMTWAGSWTVRLTCGKTLSLSMVRSVAKTNGAGEVVAAWTVRDHGYNGEGDGGWRAGENINS